MKSTLPLWITASDNWRRRRGAGRELDLAVLITLATPCRADLDERLVAAQEQTSVPTHVLGETEVLDLLLDHLGTMQL